MRTLLLTFNTLSLVFILTCHTLIGAPLLTADLVIFSYDRPLQLYALLESINTYVTGLESITIIFRTSAQDYTDAYKKVHTAFPIATFTKQGARPKEDFKQLTLEAIFKSPTQYILFAVDDNIITGPVNIAECIQILEQTKAYAFSLRLGTNLTHTAFPNISEQPVPPIVEYQKTFCAWYFSQGVYAWAYPHSVDCTIYRKTDITDDISTLNYNTPNTLEGCWAGKAGRIKSRLGLCYKHTKVINMPLNQVQRDWKMPHTFVNTFSPAELLKLFNNGFKIDIKPLYQFDNTTTHIEANMYEPTFIQREQKT